MLDFPGSANALWSVYDRTGVRPEWLIPVLAYESGLDPSRPNGQGFPYYGINQASTDKIAAAGASSVEDYLSWPASQQISRVVTPMIEGIVAKYGPIRSGARMYQANYLPGTLPDATTLDSIIVERGNQYYGPNANLDQGSKGYITLGDLATVVTREASKKYVQSALVNVYSYRPSENMTDPAYGEDFALGGLPWRLLLVGGGLGGLVWAIRSGRLKKWARVRVPVLARVLP